MTLADAIFDSLRTREGVVAIEPPGVGDGFWAGGPTAIHEDGAFWLGYRLRRPVDKGRGYANVVARSDDGIHFETVATVTSEQFGSASLERPALVRLPDGGWRLYVSCSTEGSKHWWVEALDAARVEDLPTAPRKMVLAGDADTAWKDIVVHREGDDWHLWACRHPLDGGDDEADRMTTEYATSSDGLEWHFTGTALAPTPGTWDARGTRVTSVLGDEPGSNRWTAFYDGRASAAENWHERTGMATGSLPDALTPVAGPTAEGRTLRYLSFAQVPGGVRLYWEASRTDGSHALFTEYVSEPESPSQS